MNLHKFIRRICAAAVAAALTLSLCTPVLAEGAAALPAAETGSIPINSTHFPDDHFIAYVELRCDKDGDGTLSQAELDGVTELYVAYANIKDLTGIESNRIGLKSAEKIAKMHHGTLTFTQKDKTLFLVEVTFPLP